MATLNFDASQVKPSTPSTPLPAGNYIVAITDSSTKPTKNGAGQYLEIEMTILDGEQKGRKVWDRLCINHPNAQTVEIARANLSAICHAVGVMRPVDSVELHNLPMSVKVICKKDDATGDIRNEVRGYAKRENHPPLSASQTPTPAANSVPWARSES